MNIKVLKFLFFAIAILFIIPSLASNNFIEGYIIKKHILKKNQDSFSMDTIKCFIEKLEYHNGHHSEVIYKLQSTDEKIKSIPLIDIIELQIGPITYNTILYAPIKGHVANTFAKKIEDGKLKIYQGTTIDKKATGFTKTTYYLVKNIKYHFNGEAFDFSKDVGVLAFDRYYQNHHYQHKVERFFSDYPALVDKIKNAALKEYGHGITFAKNLQKDYIDYISR